jgi:hypothetical protein
MSSETFGLTTTNADHQTNKYGIDNEAWHHVYDEYKQLQTVVGSLSEKVLLFCIVIQIK